ncbi:unnamed protein product, partial [Prorocentrum cordatum]
MPPPRGGDGALSPTRACAADGGAAAAGQGPMAADGAGPPEAVDDGGWRRRLVSGAAAASCLGSGPDLPAARAAARAPPAGISAFLAAPLRGIGLHGPPTPPLRPHLFEEFDTRSGEDADVSLLRGRLGLERRGKGVEPRFFVLRPDRLDYYTDEAQAALAGPARGRLCLSDVLSLEPRGDGALVLTLESGGGVALVPLEAAGLGPWARALRELRGEPPAAGEQDCAAGEDQVASSGDESGDGAEPPGRVVRRGLLRIQRPRGHRFGVLYEGRLEWFRNESEAESGAAPRGVLASADLVGAERAPGGFVLRLAAGAGEDVHCSPVFDPGGDVAWLAALQEAFGPAAGGPQRAPRCGAPPEPSGAAAPQRARACQSPQGPCATSPSDQCHVWSPGGPKVAPGTASTPSVRTPPRAAGAARTSLLHAAPAASKAEPSSRLQAPQRAAAGATPAMRPSAGSPAPTRFSPAAGTPDGECADAVLGLAPEGAASAPASRATPRASAEAPARDQQAAAMEQAQQLLAAMLDGGGAPGAAA